MSEDKYYEMAAVAAASGGLRDNQVAGLAHIFRQIAKDERNQVIFDFLKAVRKARRTKVVGLEHGTPNERRLWDKTRYDTFKEVEAIIDKLCDPRGLGSGMIVDARVTSTLTPPGDEKG